MKAVPMYNVSKVTGKVNVPDKQRKKTDQNWLCPQSLPPSGMKNKKNTLVFSVGLVGWVCFLQIWKPANRLMINYHN